jgi:uncharacterized protein (DUF1697 family)
MKYVALLRGINVGGNNTIDMRQLKGAFEAAGMADVRTYINSGNVIFSTDGADREAVGRALEACIVEKFGFEVDVLLRSVDEMSAIAAAIPEEWSNDDQQRCDVFYLWADVDKPSILDELGAKPGIDELRYVPGAVIRWVARENSTRSGVLRALTRPVFKRITIRNCNTARKLASLVAE